MKVVNKESCKLCGQSVNERQITLFADLVVALWSVLQWCEKNDRVIFERKEIKHLFTNENQSARFGDWILFGNLIFRPKFAKKGHYGLNKTRIEAFFNGKLKIPTVIYKNPLTKTITVDQEQYIHEIEKLSNFLTTDKDFIVRYRGSQPSFF